MTRSSVFLAGSILIALIGAISAGDNSFTPAALVLLIFYWAEETKK